MLIIDAGLIEGRRGGNSDGHEPWNNNNGIEIIFRVSFVDPSSNYWQRKKKTKQRRGLRRRRKKERKKERKKKKTEKEMKTKPLDRIVFRANVQYLDG